jgi:hypothetical protein
MSICLVEVTRSFWYFLNIFLFFEIQNLLFDVHKNILKSSKYVF